MKYILVQFPESQVLMMHERFHECLFVENIDGHDDVGSSACQRCKDRHFIKNSITSQDVEGTSFL